MTARGLSCDREASVYNGNSSYGATVGNHVGDPHDARWCWLFGVHPIQRD